MEEIRLKNGNVVMVKSPEELDDSEPAEGCSNRIYCHWQCPFYSVADVEDDDPMGRTYIRRSCNLDDDQAFPITACARYNLVRNNYCLGLDPEPEKFTRRDKDYCVNVYRNSYAQRFGKHWAM